MKFQKPKLKKTWQRIALAWGLGLIAGLAFQWLVAYYDPARPHYSKGAALAGLMKSIASPEAWFWIFLITFIVLGIAQEFWLRKHGWVDE